LLRAASRAIRHWKYLVRQPTTSVHALVVVPLQVLAEVPETPVHAQ